MGLIRKTLAVSTIGIVSPSSKKQKAAKKTNKLLAEQTKIAQAHLQLQARQAVAADQRQARKIVSAPAPLPPGITALSELAALHRAGSLTDAEFTQAKARLLNASNELS